MRNVEMDMIVKKQKETVKNLELLELLRIRKRYFPMRYEQSVYDLARKHNEFIILGRSVFLSYSGSCGAEHDEITFKTEFEAIEYSLISSLNGRETNTTLAFDDRECSICSSFYDIA